MQLETLRGAVMASNWVDLFARFQPDGLFVLEFHGQPLEVRRGGPRAFRTVQAALRFIHDDLSSVSGCTIRLVFPVDAQLQLLG